MESNTTNRLLRLYPRVPNCWGRDERRLLERSLCWINDYQKTSQEWYSDKQTMIPNMRHSLEILATLKSCYPKHPCQKPTKHVVDDHAEIEEKNTKQTIPRELASLQVLDIPWAHCLWVSWLNVTKHEKQKWEEKGAKSEEWKTNRLVKYIQPLRAGNDLSLLWDTSL